MATAKHKHVMHKSDLNGVWASADAAEAKEEQLDGPLGKSRRSGSFAAREGGIDNGVEQIDE